ncbi:MAG: AhpC/TSA family protein [Clostridium sp.]|nr:AhpC/TSA family protein [Clostridium sp.]
MKKNIYRLIAATLLLTACHQSGEQFTLEGELKNATDSTLIFEALELEGIIPLDSVRLNGSGHFSFKGKRPQNPEFYRLRIGNKTISIAVDSTETIRIQASYPNMNSNYTVTGSPLCDTLRLLTQMQADLQRQIATINNNHLTLGEQSRLIDQKVNAYKERVKKEFIAPNPASPASYFALFQSINGIMIFNPTSDPEDIRWFAAVATAWNLHYPNTPRCLNLQNITLQGLKNTRSPHPRQIEIDSEKISETGIIDISLPDLKGTTRKLSDLKGKVVLLDFTVFAAPYSQERTLELRELHNRYSDRGLVIYQVSFDPDAHFWKTSCEHLPWVCVHDEDGLNSTYTRLYHLDKLPTYFLIDRNNDIQARDTDIPDLKKAIEELL